VSDIAAAFGLSSDAVANDTFRAVASVSGPTDLVWLGQGVAVASTPAKYGMSHLNDPEHGLVLAWDGRLDNAPELAKGFECRANGVRPADAELLLHVYRALGTSCVEHLVGDFAFVLWDVRLRRLLAVRDQLGVCPLHYGREGSTWWIASRIGQLRRVPQLGRVIDEETVASFLAASRLRPEQTFLAGIRRLPPAHFLEIDEAAPRIHRYWQPTAGRTIAYEDDGEYVEHLLTLLRLTVGSRLDRVDAGGLLLSGGFDSASIAYTAAAINTAVESAARPLTALTAIIDVPGSRDTPRYTQPITDRFGFAARYVRGDASWTFTANEASACDEPLEGMYVRTVGSLLAAARKSGLQVVLTGIGADAILAGNEYYLLDLALGLRWTSLLSELRCYPSRLRRRLVFERILTPLLFRRPVRIEEPSPPGWLSPRLQASLNSYERPKRRSLRELSRQDEVAELSLTELAARMPWFRSEGLRYGVELRHPFLDRRLVDFALALPLSQKIRRGRPKALLLQAIQDRIPPPAAPSASRPQSGSHNDRGARRRIVQQERDDWERAFADPLCAELGYVDPELLRSAFLSYVSGESRLSYALARTYRLELWLKRLLAAEAHREGGTS
jgi:asparagine synthase (glutamine-hydrolysing)